MHSVCNEELERRFDEGEDITEFMDLSTARRPNAERMGLKRISIDVPEHVDDEADCEARHVLAEA